MAHTSTVHGVREMVFKITNADDPTDINFPIARSESDLLDLDIPILPVLRMLTVGSVAEWAPDDDAGAYATNFTIRRIR